MDNLNQQSQAPAGRPDDNSKEWRLIEKVLMDMQGEQKRARRWGIPDGRGLKTM